MKKSLVASYLDGIQEAEHGESYSTIFRYFYPEFATALLLYSMPYWIDAYFVAHLKSTATYAVLGNSNNLLHFIIKIADAISVSTIVLAGQFNGQGAYQQAGRALKDAFWVTVVLGSFVATALYAGSSYIYIWYGFNEEMVALGVPFLKLRAVGVFFTFVYFAFIGFMRGIKNTRTPMKLFIVGSIVFVFFDYVLIFGKLGFPQLGLYGSALASVIQYCVMMIGAMITVFFSKKYAQYSIELFSMPRVESQWRYLLALSWPLVLDKAIFAFAYIWLGSMLAKMGTTSSATFCFIKDLERFAIQPAAACAQVVTLLVSNDYGAQKWDSIKVNVKKIIFLASIMVFSILFVFSVYAHFFVGLFDKTGDFTDLAVKVFPILSILVFCDLLQLILSGALRGAANVKTVMLVRLVVCICFFMPCSWFLSGLSLSNEAVKFLLVYGSFYICNALMSTVYIHRFRTDVWKS